MKTRLILLLTTLVCLPAQAERLAYEDLVGRLTDLEALALLPPPGETTAQWSSYDRRSRYDAATGKYLDWDANLAPDRTGDGDGIIRQEEGADVLAEMMGPGCIWRIWSANALEGHLKFYLDGAEEPAIDLPFRGLFDRSNPPFTYPALVYRTEAKGADCFVPIPYNKSCKIVGERGWGRFYHFTYTTFPEGTAVPTFSLPMAAEDAAALQRVNEFFSRKLGEIPHTPPETRETRQSLSVRPGGTATIADIRGPSQIVSIEVKLKERMPRDEAASALRGAALRITWDDDKEPAVWAPLGDFFGTAPGVNRYRTLPMGMSDEEFYSYWRMPFARRALIELRNDSAAPLSLDFRVGVAPLSRPIGEYGRFHAKWRRDAFLPEDPGRAPEGERNSPHEKLRAIDWTLLKTEGRGRYCGAMLHVWNPGGGWWGEGDEKFFVDGEKFPSTFGTGSEDYFGYAWSSPDVFQRAFHSQTFNGGRNVGHVSVNRWQIADSVPFQAGFEGAIEKYASRGAPRQFAATVFWYLDPAGRDPYKAASLEDRTGYYDYILRPITTENPTAKADDLHTVLGSNASGAAHVAVAGAGKDKWRYYLWENAEPGDSIEIELPPLHSGGIFRIGARTVEGPALGAAKLALDGKTLGALPESRAAEWKDGGVIDLGSRKLKAGTHILTLRPAGSAPSNIAIQSIDFLPVDSTASH